MDDQAGLAAGAGARLREHAEITGKTKHNILVSLPPKNLIFAAKITGPHLFLRTSNIEHRTSNVEVSETRCLTGLRQRILHARSAFDVRCSMFFLSDTPKNLDAAPTRSSFQAGMPDFLHPKTGQSPGDRDCGKNICLIFHSATDIKPPVMRTRSSIG